MPIENPKFFRIPRPALAFLAIAATAAAANFGLARYSNAEFAPTTPTATPFAARIRENKSPITFFDATEPNTKLKLTASCEIKEDGSKEPLLTVDLVADETDGDSPFYTIIETQAYPLNQTPVPVGNFEPTPGVIIENFKKTKFTAKIHPFRLGFISGPDTPQIGPSIGEKIRIYLAIQGSKLFPEPKGPPVEATVNKC